MAAAVGQRWADCQEMELAARPVLANQARDFFSFTTHVNDDDFVIRMLYKDLRSTVYEHLFSTQ